MTVDVKAGPIVGTDPADVDQHPGPCLIAGRIDTHVHLGAYTGSEPGHKRYWRLVTSPEE